MSHLHIIEGVSPLTEIAFGNITYPPGEPTILPYPPWVMGKASDCRRQCGKKTENATIIVMAFNVKRSEAPKCRLRLAGEPPAHHRRGVAPYGDCIRNNAYPQVSSQFRPIPSAMGKASDCRRQCGKKTGNATIIVVAFNVKRSEAPKCRLRLLVVAFSVKRNEVPKSRLRLVI